MGNQPTKKVANKQQSPPQNAEKKQIIPDELKEDLYAKLALATLEEKEIKCIKKDAKEQGNVNNPVIVCISTKKNVVKEEKSNIKWINKETHKEIKQELTNVCNDFDAEIYDGMIILLISICFVGDKNMVKFFYDKQEDQRHIEKLKKDIVYRLDDDIAVIVDPRKAILFPEPKPDIVKTDVDEHEQTNVATRPLRPSEQMEQLSNPGDMIVWRKYQKKDPVAQLPNNQAMKPQLQTSIDMKQGGDFKEEEKGDI